MALKFSKGRLLAVWQKALVAALLLLAPGPLAAGTDLPQMEGTLFKYGPGSAQVALLSGSHPRHLVLVGGLGDGFFFANYTQLLAEALEAEGWSLVQPLLTSSHLAWGLGSLDQDAADLQLLARRLAEAYRSEGMVLLGHSTGTQDTVRYMQRHYGDPQAPPVLGTILQAPVSDREYLATLPETVARLELARRMVDQGRGEEVEFRDPDSDGAPLTARRFASLTGVGGDDDMFSTDLSDGELKERLGPLGRAPTLLVLGGADEYVPDHEAYRDLGGRMAAAVGANASAPLLVEGGSHGLEGREGEFVGAVMGFIEDL